MHKKKLIEVAIPLEEINAACKLDKDRKTGTIRNLHKWFAPMPTPALRALIFAALVDDPGDEADRPRLMDLVSKLVDSVIDTPPLAVLAEAKAAIAASIGSDEPVVLDPFCGGGSTLVKAQRLGMRSRGSDLNPIPVLISTVLTSLPPRVLGRPPVSAHSHNPKTVWSGLSGLRADIDYYGQRVSEEARQRIGHLYPPAPNGDTTVAWIWARTAPSPDPRLRGAQVPLVSNWWLSKKVTERAHALPIIRDHNSVDFEVWELGEPVAPSNSACLISGAPISFKYLREHGVRGELGTTLIALEANGREGRTYHSSDDAHCKAASDADPVDSPTLELPERAIGFRVQGYGLQRWSDLFTKRQLLALETFASLVAQVPSWVRDDGGDDDQARAVGALLSLCVGKLAQFSSSQCLWKIDSRNGTGKAESAKFGRNDVPMSWDFVETNPFGGSVGDWLQIIQTSTRALDCIEPSGPSSTRSRSRSALAAPRALVVGKRCLKLSSDLA
jgi:putative DNA methylase